MIAHDGEDEGDDEDEGADWAADLEDLLHFFYQCPVGLVEMDDAGAVLRINPAAARILTPALRLGEDMHQLHPLLRRLAPDLLALITRDPSELGRLTAGRRIVINPPGNEDLAVEALAARVDAGRVMLVLVDVTEEHRLARREHELAVQLQRAMLGKIDPDAGVSVSVTYRTAQVDHLVGGDWYDVISLPGRRVGLVVGDAVGHSVAAAAAMGQLRNAIRATAPWCEHPGELLRRVDGFAEGIEGATCSTVAYVVLHLDSGLLEYSSAGHLPPLVIRSGQAPQFLADAQNVPLACGAPPDFGVGRARLDPGHRLLLYTDGLVERRTEPLSEGLERLHRAAGDLDDVATAELCDRLADLLLEGARLEDDVCLLAVGPPGPPSGSRTTVRQSFRPEAGSGDVVDAVRQA